MSDTGEGLDYASSGVDIDLEGASVASLVGALSKSIRAPGTPGAPVDLPGGFGAPLHFGDHMLAPAPARPLFGGDRIMRLILVLRFARVRLGLGRLRPRVPAVLRFGIGGLRFGRLLDLRLGGPQHGGKPAGPG